jgi:two-component system, chemotaxis family, response regulator Rcp1
MTAAAKTPRPWNILLVEDNPAEVRLTQLLIDETGLHYVLHVARDGDQAIAIIRRQGAHASVPEPDLVLLDLNLPRRDGREVLADIKGDPALTHIPILVLSTSRAERDVLACYRLRANGYIQKPLDLDAFSATMRTITSFWFGPTVMLPGPRRDGR